MSDRMLKNGRGGWDDPRARATRGLGRMRRERPGALLARRTRTVKRCSFDARSKGQPRPLPLREVYGVEGLAWANGTSRRASGWAGENVARSWDHPTHPLVVRDSSLRPCPGQGASQGEEAVLADSGREGEVAAGVGRVRRLDFLSILRGRVLLSQTCGPLDSRWASIVLPQSASLRVVHV